MNIDRFKDICFLEPESLAPLTLTRDGLCRCDSSRSLALPFVGGVLRCSFEADNYTASFGLQWTTFAREQLDSELETSTSKNRLVEETGWDLKALGRQELVLEVGSGAGRFTEVLLRETEALICSVDFSSAIDVNYSNNGGCDRLLLLQASIYELPFRAAQFDKVLCLGVLQHTPDFRRSLECLAQMVRPGGQLVVDFYPIRGFWTKLHAKYLLRPMTKRLPRLVLMRIISENIDWLIRAYRMLCALGLRPLTRLLPICDIDGTLPVGLPNDRLRQLCILDTFDMLSPAFDNPQRVRTVARWMGNCGLIDIWSGYVELESGTAAVARGTATTVEGIQLTQPSECPPS